MSLNILIYGLNYFPEETGCGKYSGELGEWLAQRGHDVSVVCAPPYYPMWKIHKTAKNKFYQETINGVRIYRSPLYVPSKSSTFKRVIHLLSFVFFSMFNLIRLIRLKPDVVVNVIPTLFTTVNAWLYCKCTGAKLVVHVQDFEGNAVFGLGMARQGLLSRIYARVESFLLSRADKVTTISNAMMEIAKSKGVTSEKVELFPNWSNLDMFKGVTADPSYRESLGIPKHKQVLLYSGNLGRKQGLEKILEMAEKQSQLSDRLFVIVGDGVAKNQLLQEKENKNLENVLFLPLQPYEDLPQLLLMADVHLVLQKSGVADAVLPSKLTNILAVGGHAVVTASLGTELGDLAERHQGVYKRVEPECVDSLMRGVDSVLTLDSPNETALEYAGRYLSKDEILCDFEAKLVSLVSSETSDFKTEGVSS